MSNIEELKSKRAIDLTGEELADIVLSKLLPQINKYGAPETVKGLSNIAKLLEVGKSTVIRLIDRGVISDAVRRDGKMIFADAEYAKQLYKQYTNRKKYPKP